MSDLETVVVNSLAEAHRENGRLRYKLAVADDSLKKLEQEIGPLRNSNTNLKIQCGRAEKEASESAPKFKALYEAADILIKTLAKPPRKDRHRILSTQLIALRKALNVAHDCIDWIPF